ncbi:MAG: DUF192 domain-containing protein [Candidatus Rifleibacteriota bacterium]
MKTLKISRQSDKKVIGSRILVADSFISRFRGLMLASEPADGEGLLISPCNSIHMMFMRFPIDAIFIDAKNRIRSLYRRLTPWLGFVWIQPEATSVIELKAGTIDKTGVEIDDILEMEPI